MFKAALVGGGLLLGGAYLLGAIGGASYSRTVERPPADVIAALVDLDIRDQPGSPSTDPARAGGIAPTFRESHGTDFMRWDVMSGSRVATTMWVELTPLDDGRRTRVTAHVERGDAPDDLVSPAFRNEGMTMGLFSMAIEDELADLTRPAVADAAKCDEIMQDFADSGIPEPGEPLPTRPTDVRGALGEYGRSSLKVAGLQQRMHAAGCDTAIKQTFQEVSNRMTAAAPAGGGPAGGVTFTPGQPMVNPNPGGTRFGE